MYDRSKAEKFSTGWGGSALGIDSKPIWQPEGLASCGQSSLGKLAAMVMKSWTRAMSKQTGGDDGGSIMLMRPDGTEYLALRLRAVVCLDLGLRPFTVSVASVYRNLLRLHS